MRRDDVYSDLKRVLGGGKVSRDPVILSLHTRDAAYLRGDAYAVVYPTSVEDVRKVVQYCFENDVKIYPQGGSSELTGSSIPNGDGIILSFIKMRRVLEYSVGDSYIYVEPGLSLYEVNQQVERHNQIFPIDPSSLRTATVGGAVSTGAGGLKGFRYGLMRDWVLGLDLVLPDEEATLLKLNYKTLKSREGYDLVRLIVGSEGTLALVVGAVLRLAPSPGPYSTVAGFFSNLDSLVEASIALRMNIPELLILEFVDASTVEKVVGYGRVERLGEGHMLIAASTDDSEKMVEYMRRYGADSILVAETPSEADEMGIYEVRRGFYPVLIDEAVAKTGGEPAIYIEDVSVPPTKLSQFLREVREVLEKSGVSYGLAGHIGDGNIHPTMWAPRSEIDRLYRVGEEIMDIAIEYGGVVSSEHGIGVVKRGALVRSLRRRGLKALELMRGIKKVFDPRNILNPGKVIGS